MDKMDTKVSLKIKTLKKDKAQTGRAYARTLKVMAMCFPVAGSEFRNLSDIIIGRLMWMHCLSVKSMNAAKLIAGCKCPWNAWSRDGTVMQQQTILYQCRFDDRNGIHVTPVITNLGAASSMPYQRSRLWFAALQPPKGLGRCTSLYLASWDTVVVWCFYQMETEPVKL